MNKSAIVALLFAICTRTEAAGTLTGKVTSAGEGRGEPLIGAVVLVQGTVRGASTNLKGEFRISDLPPGTYTVVVTMVGYLRDTRHNVQVEDGKETSLDVALLPSPVQLDQVVVTASKHQQSLEEVPVSISVLDAAQFKMRNSLSIDDALRYVSGVNTMGYQVNIRGSSGYAYGIGSRVLMLLDGMPFMAGDTGELTFESVPVAQIDRVEVVKGASSALYGSNALGGVINVITKEIPEHPETDVRMYTGMYDKPHYAQWQWSDKNRFFNGQSVSHAFRTGDLGVSVFFSRQLDDGYRMNDYRRRYNMFLKLKETISKATSYTGTFGLLDQIRGSFLLWRSLDSALVPLPLQVNDNVRSTRFFFTNQVNTVFSDGMLLTVRGLWYHNLWGLETLHGYGRAESQADDFRLEAVTTLIPAEDHTVTGGVEGNVDAIGGDVLQNATIGGFALFGQDEWKLAAPLSLTLGLRFDYQSVGVTAPGNQLNPKIAVNYIPVDGTSLRASFGRGFRVPSLTEASFTATISGITFVPDSVLLPERSLSYEVGVSQRLWDFGLLDVALFRSDYENLIEVHVASTGFALGNVPKARVQGYEASLKLGALEGALQLSLGYTYVDPEDLTNKRVLKYRPRHVFTSNLTAQTSGIHAGVDFRYLSRVEEVDKALEEGALTEVVRDLRYRTEAIVTDLRLGADFNLLGLPMSADLHINNIFRYNYVELIGNMMPPRNYVFALQLRP